METSKFSQMNTRIELASKGFSSKWLFKVGEKGKRPFSQSGLKMVKAIVSAITKSCPVRSA